MDLGKAEHARQLLDNCTKDQSALFQYSRAFIEYISKILEEPDSSIEKAETLLQSGNNQ